MLQNDLFIPVDPATSDREREFTIGVDMTFTRHLRTNLQQLASPPLYLSELPISLQCAVGRVEPDSEVATLRNGQRFRIMLR
jgi:hypothetical protein